MKLVITPRAEADMDAIATYIESEAGRSTAKKFIQEMKIELQMLRHHPRMCEAQLRYGPNIRRMVVNPYLVFYRIKKQAVYILRVLHTARDITRTMIK